MLELYKIVILKNGKKVMPIEIGKDCFVAVDSEGKSQTYEIEDIKQESLENSKVIVIKPKFVEDNFFVVEDEKEKELEKEESVPLKVEEKIEEVKVIPVEKELYSDGDEYDV